MPPKKRFITCEICGYRSRRTNGEQRMFMAKFPLDEDRCKQWVEVVGKEDLIYVPIEKLHTLKFVCGNHFKDRDFNKNKSRLKKTAVPSKHLNAAPLSDEMLNEFPCHITSDINDTEDYVRQIMCDKTDKPPNPRQVESVPSYSESYNLVVSTKKLSDEKISQKVIRKRSLHSGLKQSIKAIVESDHSYCSQKETLNAILYPCDGYNAAPDDKNCLLQTSKSGELHTKGLKQSIKAIVESDHSYCSQKETLNVILCPCDGYNAAPDDKNCLLLTSKSGELYTKGNTTITHLSNKELLQKCLCIAHFDSKYIVKNTGPRKRISRYAIPKHYAGYEDPPSPIPATSQGMSFDVYSNAPRIATGSILKNVEIISQDTGMSFDVYSNAPRIATGSIPKNVEIISQDTGHSPKGSEPKDSNERDSQNDHEEDTLPKSETPLPNSDMPLQKSDVDESAIFSWQAEIFVKDEEVFDGHWQDEVETSLYQDQAEAKVDNSALPDESETEAHNSAHPDEGYTYRCNDCGENITGFRYTCVQCLDWDLCGACEVRAAHAAHYVLRVPRRKPYKETQAILAIIRRQLLQDNVFIQGESDGLKTEVKEEPGVTLDPQPEDDPLASGEIIQEEYIEEMTSETESIAGHQLPRKRPRLHSRSDQSVTSDVSDTTKSDDDIEEWPNVEPNADAWGRLRNTPEETTLDDQTTRCEARSLIESQHKKMPGRTLPPHQNLHNEDSRNNTHWTDSNTQLQKRREVNVVPESQLKSKSLFKK